MIAKEKKQAIIAEYGRTPNDTGSPGGSDCNSFSKNRRVNRAFQAEPKGSSLKKRNVKDDRSETWITCIP